MQNNISNLSIEPYIYSIIFSICIVILTIVILGYARYSRTRFPFDISEPKSLFKRLPGWGKRAVWAHENTLESFSLYIPAVILVIIYNILGFNIPEYIPKISYLFPLFRLIYLFAYIFNYPYLRALSWGGGIIFTLCLYLVPFSA